MVVGCYRWEDRLLKRASAARRAASMLLLSRRSRNVGARMDAGATLHDAVHTKARCAVTLWPSSPKVKAGCLLARVLGMDRVVCASTLRTASHTPAAHFGRRSHTASLLLVAHACPYVTSVMYVVASAHTRLTSCYRCCRDNDTRNQPRLCSLIDSMVISGPCGAG